MSDHRASTSRRAVAGLAAFALIGGGVTLVGWCAGAPRLTDWLSSGISMFPNAAFAAACCGAALILTTSDRTGARQAGGTLGVLVLLLGVATLAEHLTGIDLGVDRILINPGWESKAAVSPGRMGPPASLSFSLLGLALLLHATGSGRAKRLVPALGIAVSAISLLSLTGYLSGADPLFAVAKFTGIAMQTAGILLALSLGVVASVPDRDPMRTFRANSAAGVLARRSLPFIVGLPIVLGCLRVWGQHAGYFDTAMGTALLSLTLATAFCGLLWWWVGTVAGHERALARARDLHATTLASIGDAVIVTDEKGAVTFLNAEAERLTGWKGPEADGEPLSSVFRIINEQTRQPAENPVEKVIRTGKVAGPGNHTLLISKDGTETPIDDSAAPIREPDLPLSGVVLVFRDVTERRKAEQTRARLSAIVEFSGDAVLSQSLDGKILTWNAGAERIFGYRQDEIVGKPVGTIHDPETRAQEKEILDRLRQGLPFETLESVRLAKDGRRIPVSVTVSPIKDSEGRVTGASKVLRDITELRAAREALAREKNLLETTLASIGDGVVVTDAQGRVTFLNAEAERLTGWKSPEAQGKELPAVFRIVDEETRQTVESPVEKVLRFGQVVGLADHTLLIGKDGTETPIDDSAAPIRAPGGPLFGVVLVFRDFTEQKKAGQAVLEARATLEAHSSNLERTVGERTAKLREMVDELQHVSYSITHDMRAPLRAMTGFSEMLLESAGSLSPENQDRCRRILIGATRLDRLIQDALSYSRAVLQHVPMEPVDLSKLVRGLLDTYPNLHSEKADIRIEGDLPVVLGNEGLLTQCFSNLLGNAVKFVAPGVRPEVRVRPEIGSETVTIWIRDNGIGIPKHAQNRLFGMFEKLDNQYEGTGIGLAIVRKVVERMGGQVGVESEPGKGSGFWVTLRRPPGTPAGSVGGIGVTARKESTS